MVEHIPAHQPVMLVEAVAALAVDPEGFYVDCTFGRGGHARAILRQLGPKGRLLALDKDLQAVEAGKALSAEDRRLVMVHGSFADLKEHVARQGEVGQVAGVLMDLGVSSPQLEDAARGFSFLRDGPLDMRMDSSRGVTAAEWLSRVDEAELMRVLRDYGEERYARRIARAIVAARPIVTTRELARVIERAVPMRERHKHPATRSFQAIRIAVNQELEELPRALQQAVDVLRPGGRLVVISFHSLEDRLVKRFMREQAQGEPEPLDWLGVARQQARLRRLGKALRPGMAEIESNVRARSAILRVAERLAA